MPELPEVETIVRDLAPAMRGARIIRVQVHDPLLVRFPDQEGFRRRLLGRIICRVERRGKYIIIGLDQGLNWLVHLRMTGQLLAQPGAGADRALIRLDNGTDLHYCDLRRFGNMWAIWPGEEVETGGYQRLGPEPLAPDFDDDWLATVFARRVAPLKSLLLDQTIVAGLGNIYTDEALFAAKLAPRRRASSLSKGEREALVQGIKQVLSRAIRGRGTTFRDYRSGLGTAGGFQNCLNVYGRGGQSCRRCGSTLSKDRIGGRTTVFCPTCQQ